LIGFHCTVDVAVFLLVPHYPNFFYASAKSLDCLCNFWVHKTHLMFLIMFQQPSGNIVLFLKSGANGFDMYIISYYHIVLNLRVQHFVVFCKLSYWVF